MKITIKPTEVKPDTPVECINPTVVVAMPTDELTIDQVAVMLEGALIAFGYAPETVKSIFKE